MLRLFGVWAEGEFKCSDDRPIGFTQSALNESRALTAHVVRRIREKVKSQLKWRNVSLHDIEWMKVHSPSNNIPWFFLLCKIHFLTTSGFRLTVSPMSSSSFRNGWLIGIRPPPSSIGRYSRTKSSMSNLVDIRSFWEDAISGFVVLMLIIMTCASFL